MTTIIDRYDQEVERLTNEPKLIENSWHCCGPLFAFCKPSGSDGIREDGKACGCPTLIRGEYGWVAWTDELTELIRADDRLPKSYRGIRREHLPAFAEIQRKLDAALHREPPEML